MTSIPREVADRTRIQVFDLAGESSIGVASLPQTQPWGGARSPSARRLGAATIAPTRPRSDVVCASTRASAGTAPAIPSWGIHLPLAFSGLVAAVQGPMGGGSVGVQRGKPASWCALAIARDSSGCAATAHVHRSAWSAHRSCRMAAWRIGGACRGATARRIS